MSTPQWEPAEGRGKARPASAVAAVAVLVALGVGLALAGRWDAGGDGTHPDELAIETADPGSEPAGDVGSSGGEAADDESGESADRTGGSPQRVGQWVDMAESPLTARADPVAVWTGENVIVWGGVGEERWGETHEDGSYSGGVNYATRVDGAIYDPAADRWREMPDAPLREGQLGWFGGVWTGRELVVLSDVGAAAYDPETDGWRHVAEPPEGAWSWHTAVWTGEAVAVLGSSGGGDAAIAYSPADDRWTTLPDPPITDPRTAGMNGRMVVYGRREGESGAVNAITAYDSETREWSPPERLPVEQAVGDRLKAIAADPIRDRVLLLGVTRDGSGLAPILASWRPDAGWRSVPRHADASEPVPDDGLIALRQGTILWLPAAGSAQLFSYKGWAPLADDPLGRRRASAVVWTGRELIAWGGRADRSLIDGGARWRYRTDEDLVGGPTAPLEPPTRGEWPFRAQPD